MADGGAGGPTFDSFIRTLNSRIYYLAQEIEKKTRNNGDFNFVFPVGMFLVLDTDNGGDVTGEELIKRFHLLHAESRNAIDFYFLGWQWINRSEHSKGIKFDLDSFEDCRNALKKAGVKKFGGSADLILVDVRYRQRSDTQGGRTPYGYSELDFNFPEAIRVNLSTSRENKEIPPLGDFLQSIISVAEELHEEGGTSNPVFSISDRLGIATARGSFLDFILKKWGAIIGADKLATLAVRNLGPVATFYGDTRKDNVFAPGDVKALSPPRLLTTPGATFKTTI